MFYGVMVNIFHLKQLLVLLVQVYLVRVVKRGRVVTTVVLAAVMQHDCFIGSKWVVRFLPSNTLKTSSLLIAKNM